MSEMRQWYQIELKAKSKSAEIMIYGAIGPSFFDESAVPASAFIKEMKSLGDIEELSVRLNSPGGSAFDGIAIHNAIQCQKTP